MLGEQRDGRRILNRNYDKRREGGGAGRAGETCLPGALITPASLWTALVTVSSVAIPYSPRKNGLQRGTQEVRLFWLMST